jgi:lysophospholipase L1-like esterase
MFASLIACAVLTQATVPTQLIGVKRIVMLGDSITQLGANPKGYVTLVANGLKVALPSQPIEVINAGISGHKSTDMQARFQKDVLDKKPDLVTISVGVNDVWHNFRTADWSKRVPTGDSGRGVELPQFEQKLREMILAAKAANVKVLLLSPTLVYEDLDGEENRRVSTYVRAGQKLATELDVPYLNLYRGFRESVLAFQRRAGMSTLLLTTDGVHLNDAGNALMAGMILKALGVNVENQISPK